MIDTDKCFGYFAECKNSIPDGVSDDGTVLYWKISCPRKDECYKDWIKSGGRVGMDDPILLMESRK
jgi:hypothetical protein